MKTVGIIYNEQQEKAVTELPRTKKNWKARGCLPTVTNSRDGKLPSVDYAITPGGDGTMLSASRMLAAKGVPVLGINLGSMGFLAETNTKELYSFLADIIKDEYSVEERAMLAITVLRAGGKTLHETALNDIIFHSGSNGRIITISSWLDEDFIADYTGDGLIIATPTGSTAYSLASGGPIVHPDLSVFTLTPICPHTLTERPIIVSSSHTLRMKSETYGVEKAAIFIDGQIRHEISENDTVTVTLSPTPLKLITNPKRKYLKVLREKLRWGERG